MPRLKSEHLLQRMDPMSRTTIDFGIDLGTTNSAIAVLKDVKPEIIKNNWDADITPSAVSIDKRAFFRLASAQRAKSSTPRTILTSNSSAAWVATMCITSRAAAESKT